MFYANFLYFIIAIILFSSAPQSRTPLFSLYGDLIWMGLVIFLFWQFNRSHFRRLRTNLDAELLERREDGKDDDRVFDEAREELLKGDIDPLRLRESLFRGAARPSGRDPADDEDCDGAENVEAVSGRDHDDLIDDLVSLLFHIR